MQMPIEIIPNWHPLFVHFTIALFQVATMLLVGGIGLKLLFKSEEVRLFSEKIINGAYINLWLGCLMTVGTVLAGWYAYNTVAHDTASHAAMTDHRNWAMVTSFLFLGLTIWSTYLYRKQDKENKFFVIGMIVASLILAITGWKGGEVVYRYGLGVISLPKTDTHGHSGTEMPDHHGSDTKTDSHGHEHGRENQKAVESSNETSKKEQVENMDERKALFNDAAIKEQKQMAPLELKSSSHSHDKPH